MQEEIPAGGAKLARGGDVCYDGNGHRADIMGRVYNEALHCLRSAQGLRDALYRS